MFNFTMYGWCVLGIIISVVLPILRQALPKPVTGGMTSRSEPVGANEQMRRVWKIAWPFLALGLFSALSAFLVVAGAGESLKDYRAALLAGYAWDSTLQKLKG